MKEIESEMKFRHVALFLKKKLVGGAKIVWTHLKFERDRIKKDKMIFVEMICLISNKSLLKRIEVWMEGLKLDIWMLKNSWIQENTFIFCWYWKKIVI